MFSGGWPGDATLDGPGMTAYLRLALDEVRSGGGAGYWIPELWAGTPAWALAPSTPILVLVPLGLWLGPETAIKLATLGIQVLAGWGAFVLARSLWGTTVVPLVAGLLYALHPLLVAHAALFGHETSAAVMAITPWLAWSVRKALRPEWGWRYSVLTGLLGALAVLHQAEHAYGLAILCGLQFAVELGRAARLDRRRAALVVKRTGVAVAVAAGAIAFWLLPLMALRDWFVFTPSEVVRASLGGSPLVHDARAFVRRIGALDGAYGFNRPFFTGTFYLGWVCLLAAFAAILALRTDDEDGHLSAIGVAGAVCLWLSTAGARIPEAGRPGGAHIVILLGLAAVTGALVTRMLRHLVSSRVAFRTGVAAGAVIFVGPFLYVYQALQKAVPLLAHERFPRFYPVAVLGLTLGAAWSVMVATRWARGRRFASVGVLATVLVVAFLLDSWPYRSFYQVHLPATDAAYSRALSQAGSLPAGSRVAFELYGDPRSTDAHLVAGHELSVGWPHPVAGKDVWRLTAEAFRAPLSYQHRALGLSGTVLVTEEEVAFGGTGSEAVKTLHVERNPWALPRVRAYAEAVVVGDAGIAPELAVALAHRNIAVISGGAPERVALADLSPAVVDDPDACDGAVAAGAALAGAVARACSLHPWIGSVGRPFTVRAEGVGGAFVAGASGLSGVGVWFDRPPGPTELVLYEDGREARRARSSDADVDEAGVSAFRFPPIEDSAGKRYAFSLSCPACTLIETPRMRGTEDPRGPGTLDQGGVIDATRAAAFSVLYGPAPEARPSSTVVTADRPGAGEWSLQVSGGEPALVVVADAYFPGWAATVDGRPAPVLRADGAFVGVAVPAGDHHVELAYRPPPAATAGRAVTGGTVALLVLAGARSGWRRRGKAARPE